MSFNYLRKRTHLSIAGFLLGGALVFALPFSHTGEVLKAHAQFGGLSGGVVVKDIDNIIANTMQTLTLASIEQKELVLDGLFRDIAQKALQKLTGDILKWVNSGFDGEPAFVTDLLGSLQEISDDIAADFIYGEELNTVCSPFQLDVRIALATKYQEENYGGFKEAGRCTINKPGVDVGAFLSGDFNAGGWTIWFETILNPQNTPMGAAILGEKAANERIAAEQYSKTTKWNWANGFESLESCVTVGTGASATQKCGIATPGILIQEQATAALNAPMQSLLNADEFDEVINALFGNLAQKAISGVNGLLGLGGNSSFSDNTFGGGGNLSYLDAIAQESAEDNGNTPTGNRILQALNAETKVLELELSIVEEIDAITTLFEEKQEPFKNDSCWDLELPEELDDKLGELVLQVPITVTSVVTLQELSTKYEEADSSREQLSLLKQFAELQSENVLGGQTAVIEYDYYLNSQLKELIESLIEEIEDAENAC